MYITFHAHQIFFGLHRKWSNGGLYISIWIFTSDETEKSSEENDVRRWHFHEAPSTFQEDWVARQQSKMYIEHWLPNPAHFSSKPDNRLRIQRYVHRDECIFWRILDLIIWTIGLRNTIHMHCASDILVIYRLKYLRCI